MSDAVAHPQEPISLSQLHFGLGGRATFPQMFAVWMYVEADAEPQISPLRSR